MALPTCYIAMCGENLTPYQKHTITIKKAKTRVDSREVPKNMAVNFDD